MPKLGGVQIMSHDPSGMRQGWIASGILWQFDISYWSYGHRQFVSLPELSHLENVGSFHTYVNIHQRVSYWRLPVDFTSSAFGTFHDVMCAQTCTFCGVLLQASRGESNLSGLKMAHCGTPEKPSANQTWLTGKWIIYRWFSYETPHLWGIFHCHGADDTKG